MKIEHKSVPFEVMEVKDAGEAGAPPGGSFTGLGACLMNIDAHGDILAPGSLKADLPKFLSDGFIGGMNHNWDDPLGHPASAEEVAAGLMFTAALDDVPAAQKLRKQMKVNPATGRATIRKLSIGYKTLESEPFADADAVKAWWAEKGYAPSEADASALAAFYTKRKNPATGKDYVPGIRLLKRVYLYEVSPVAVPANDRAAIVGAKYYDGGGYAVPMGGTPGDPEDGPLGDTDEVLAWASMGRLHDLLCMALYSILGNEMAPVPERLALIGEAVDQFKAALLGVLGHFLAADDAEAPAAGAMAGAVESMSQRFKARFGMPDSGDFAAELRAATAPGFAEQSRLVASAVEGFVDRADARVGARLKDGRELSAANRAALAGMRDGLHAHAETLTDLLDRTDRKPAKAAPEADPQEKVRGEGVDDAPAPPEPETKPEAKRVDPALVRGLHTKHLDTKREALMAACRER